jgi:hypothetical protein
MRSQIEGYVTVKRSCYVDSIQEVLIDKVGQTVYLTSWRIKLISTRYLILLRTSQQTLLFIYIV